jgi:hypothetical protein
LATALPKLTAQPDLRNVIPDWRNGYPDVEALSPEQVAAEFLRRNRIYQRWWRDHVDEDGYLKPFDREDLNRFGLAFPIGIDGMASLTFFLPTAARYLRGSTSSLSESDVAVVIDLSLPLDEQIVVAAEDLKGLQLHRIKLGKITPRGTKQVRRQNYVLYLRLLDAEACGATDGEIGEVLYPELNNDYPECRRTKRLSDDRKVAHELRDGGYVRLAAKTRPRPKRPKRPTSR